MKKKRIFVGIFILVIILSGGYILSKNPVIEGHTYNKDRIEIVVDVFLDGKKVSLESLKSVGSFEGKECEISSKDGIYKTRGGEYGEYKFNIDIPAKKLGDLKKDIELNLKYINSNNWYISKSNCIINLYTGDNGEIYGNASVFTDYNDGSSYKNTYNWNIIKNVIDINWGL